MNSKRLLLILIVSTIFVGCDKAGDKSSAGAGDPNHEVEAKPFHGEVYRSLNGSETLTIISQTECELQDHGDTFLGKYTKQPDALRVIISPMGGSVVVYYRLTEQGLQAKDGTVLLAPGPYKAAIQRANDTRRERAAKLTALVNESKRRTEPIFTFKTYNPQNKKVTGIFEAEQCFIVYNPVDSNGKKQGVPEPLWYGNTRVATGGVPDGIVTIIDDSKREANKLPTESSAAGVMIANRLHEIVEAWRQRYEAAVEEANTKN